MSCPRCGCKVCYEYDEEDAPDEFWERCSACGVVFHIDDHAPEDDDHEESSNAS
jgi:hypothetical protein